MGAESLNRVGTHTGAVFLSYASQDADAAQRICEALRAAGLEVWFDQSELRGGDAWDQKIRRELHDCALFMPVISAHTAARQHVGQEYAVFAPALSLPDLARMGSRGAVVLERS